MAFTPEQYATIKQAWEDPNRSVQSKMADMQQYGVDVDAIAQATGADRSQIGNALVDAGAERGFGGYSKGITDTYSGSYQWGKQAQPVSNSNSVAGPVAQSSNLGMGGGQQSQGQYTPNPYLDKMAQGITSHMYDNWTRNQLPSIRSGAMAAGGFGGSRQGVVEANGLNDMNRSLGQNLTNLYGSDYNNAMGRNLQQQQINNGYDLGLRSSDLGFSNLDANIAQNNFGNQMQAANFGMGVYSTLNNQTQNGINAGTNIQNTPLDYQKYFTNSANGVGSGYGTSSTSQNNTGNPWLGALGGAMMGNQIQKNWG